jgi:hypothetical protein
MAAQGFLQDIVRDAICTQDPRVAGARWMVRRKMVTVAPVTIWLIWMLPDESKVCFVMYAWRQLSRASMPWKVSPACVLSYSAASFDG